MTGCRAPAGPLAPPAGRCAAPLRAGAPPLPSALGRAGTGHRCAGRARCAPVAQAPPGGPNGKGAGGNVIRFFSKGEASAEPAAAGPSAAGSAAMADVLRAIRLLEQRETELRDEMKNILGLMAASAEALQQGATEPRSALSMAAARLERAYSGERSPAAAEESEAGTTAEDTTECTVQHPGALCCTRTTIQLDDATKNATLTLRTTVKRNGDALADARISANDIVALGAQALCIAANELSCQRTASASELPGPSTRTHAELVDILAHGVIVHAEPNSSSNGNHPTYRVELEHRGARARAIFKPRIEGDGDGWHRAPMEWVAYELNLMLGMDYVPPVAYRRGGIECDYQHFEEGAFIHFVPEACELREAPQKDWGVPEAALLSDTRILDVLLANSDRHHGHFLHGVHWCPPHRRQPVLIDHAAAFRKEAFVTLDHENAFRTGAVRCVSSRTYLRLRFLDARAIAARFAGTLSTGEMRALLTRRNGVLERLDALVDSQGYEATVIEL